MKEPLLTQDQIYNLLLSARQSLELMGEGLAARSKLNIVIEDMEKKNPKLKNKK